jgi:DNA repair protein RadC
MQEQITEENLIIKQDLSILSNRVSKEQQLLNSPGLVKEFLTLKLGQKENEVFGVMWLNIMNKLIAYDEIFNGTLDNCAVYPREIVKEGLKHNARSVILFHNHPGGDTTPSAADIECTQSLYDALKLVDICILDHLIVAGDKMISFVE